MNVFKILSVRKQHSITILRSVPQSVYISLLIFAISSCSKTEETPEDIPKLVAEMSQRVVATGQLEQRNDLIPRYNQPKTVACLSGEFNVSSEVPDNLKHGLFAEPGSYPVYARFANASKWDDSEKDIRGLSLRVSETGGDSLWGESGQQDFLFNSYPALFVATPEEFLAFTRARQAGLEGEKFSLIKFFLNPFDSHLKSLFTVLKARKKHKSPLDIRYWSTVPSALDGTLDTQSQPSSSTQAVKYALTPCSEYQTEQAIEPGENQLRAAINAHLENAQACFEFGVQVQTDPEQMPIEDASVVWDESQSPFVTVATVSFEQQAFQVADALQTCEASRFNPWQSLPAHRPLGRMNAVRKEIYAAGAQQRENR